MSTIFLGFDGILTSPLTDCTTLVSDLSLSSAFLSEHAVTSTNVVIIDINIASDFIFS
ncbi:TPA: hypothetical protein ACXIB3_001479 [Clostridioides difficile]